MDKRFKKVCNIAPNGNSFTALSGGHLTVTFAYHYNLLMLLACSVKRISFIIVDAYFYPVRVISILQQISMVFSPITLY